MDIPPSPADPAVVTPSASTTQVPRTRAGAAWVGICAAALAAVVLIVFMLQNTRTVQISFLWMDGSLPLAMALLIAGVGVGIVTMLIGTARLTQLRRLARRRRQPATHAGPPSSEPGNTATTD
ncbi:lipopolysaccharide assembly protein LapA domain-containing protein [Kribbella sp. NPDC051620]|uniref:lipopolysaccharide assembly protein LapA domain-containing protein n=1 Tax=Kribbella sp. NPDC051620 TaxID=3364120 RepID=UPI003798C738